MKKETRQIEEEYKNIEKAEEQLTIVKESLSHVQDETMKKTGEFLDKNYW